jgi:predicted transglutaminase-like cysteine proteinase
MPVMSRVLFVLLLTATAALVPRPAAADWGRLDAVATGRAIPGPSGWLSWCLAGMARCAPGQPERPLAATQELLALLQRVQAEVNQAIAPQPEPNGRDLWQIGAPSGDCEDYALTKQERLLAAGLPRAAVRLATVRLPNGERHALLAVEADRGTLVLDNLRRAVVPLRALPYTWLSVQGSNATLLWHELAAVAPKQPAIASPAGGVGGTDSSTSGTGTIA